MRGAKGGTFMVGPGRHLASLHHWSMQFFPRGHSYIVDVCTFQHHEWTFLTIVFSKCGLIWLNLSPWCLCVYFTCNTTSYPSCKKEWLQTDHRWWFCAKILWGHWIHNRHWFPSKRLDFLRGGNTSSVFRQRLLPAQNPYLEIHSSRR